MVKCLILRKDGKSVRVFPVPEGLFGPATVAYLKLIAAQHDLELEEAGLESAMDEINVEYCIHAEAKRKR